jgi:hypothetical protein
MMRNAVLPRDLNTNIGSERKDFAVKAGRAQPTKASLALILFGTFWTAFTSIFVFAFLGPLFVGKEVHFESNGVPTVAGPDNLGPIVVPAMIIGLFVLIGLGMLAGGFYSMFKKGGFYVGTPLRLIHYRKGTIRSMDWEQFSGNIEVKARKQTQKGNISLQMRTGRMVSRKNAPDRYVPDVIFMSEIPNVIEIERICRRRIKENDPSPPNTGLYKS